MGCADIGYHQPEHAFAAVILAGSRAGIRRVFRKVDAQRLFDHGRVMAAAPVVMACLAGFSFSNQCAFHHRHVAFYAAQVAVVVHGCFSCGCLSCRACDSLAARSVPAFAYFGHRAAGREAEKGVPALTFDNMAAGADTVGVINFLYRVRCVCGAQYPENFSFAVMAGGAGNALVLQGGIESGIVFQHRLPFCCITVGQHGLRLLAVQWCVAQAAVMLLAVKAPVCLEIGVGPGLRVDACLPFPVEGLVAVTAVLCAQVG